MVSKLEVGRPDGKLKFPPNNCIPEKYQFYNKGIVGYNGYEVENNCTEKCEYEDEEEK